MPHETSLNHSSDLAQDEGQKCSQILHSLLNTHYLVHTTHAANCWVPDGHSLALMGIKVSSKDV